MTETGPAASYAPRRQSVDRAPPRLLPIFQPCWLQVFGYSLAVFYVFHFIVLYREGRWLFDGSGFPIFNDFTDFWVYVRQVLFGKAATLHDQINYDNIISDVAKGANKWNLSYLKWPWPFPPIFLLIMAPFSVVPYVASFLCFLAVTLLPCIAVVWLIVRRPPAVALLLALPFNVHEVYWGQTGFLKAALLGAALLSLEWRPALAGLFIGCLTFEPHYGVLIPVALIAGKKWRAFASAAATTIVLAATSIAAFGLGPWATFAHALVTQADDTLLQGVPGAPQIPWSAVQSIYGLVRTFGGGAAMASVVQGAVTIGSVAAVWRVWRSSTRYELKAALLPAAALLAMPYGWTHDLVMIAVPVAFLAADQMRYGLLRGEQSVLIALFVLALALMTSQGNLPLGALITTALVGLIVRRVLYDIRPEANFFETPVNVGD